ncbi:hypothetical protein ACIOJD_26745 [Streptomyces sp. NPDC088116]|uniref:hypothetical protein n=1 Tax=Streptomyces sp. NPDC088116 TaxID=3365825 RepID=UPI0037F788F4
MKIVGRALVAAGAAVMLGVGFPLNAQAAQGSFSYHTKPGNHQAFLNNPQDQQCYTVGRAGGLTENNTNRDAVLYSHRNCSGSAVTMHPGDSRTIDQFVSVKFVR